MALFRFLTAGLTAGALLASAAAAQETPGPAQAPVAPEQMIPEGGIEDEPLGDKAPEAAASGSIIDVLANSGRFTLLVEAVEAAGLAERLGGEGPFTLFAPSDEAFETLPGGTLESLMQPENADQLERFLSYHVVEGELDAAELAGQANLLTLQGDPLTVLDEDDGLMIDGARIVESDLDAANGIVHVLDAVLAPVSDSTRG